MPHSKAELRSHLKQIRLELSDEDRNHKSAAIVERLKQAVDWSGARSVHYFEPLHQLGEPDIGPFIIWLEDNYPQLQLVGTHGGPPPPAFDIIIVPMLGFDPQTRHRIGYGGGYYDKFLAAQKQAQKIGVCFEQGSTAELLAEPHDIALDVIVTEWRIL